MKKKFNQLVNNSTDINKKNNHFSPQYIEYKKKATTLITNQNTGIKQIIMECLLKKFNGKKPTSAGFCFHEFAR